jgi:hypothetical protein
VRGTRRQGVPLARRRDDPSDGTKGQQPSSIAVTEATLEAQHAAQKIVDRLEIIGLRNERVLENLYTDRDWPGPLVHRFGPAVGVVEGLVDVRASYLHARMEKRTSAPNTTGWLKELVAQRSRDLVAWRKQAFDAVEQAFEAYERARNGEAIVVPQEQW